MRRLLPADRRELSLPPHVGLSTDNAERLRRRYGSNDIVCDSRSTWIAVLGDTLRDPMLWFLTATSGLYFLLGERTEAVVLLVALIPLVGMDLVLHWRATASTEHLGAQLDRSATVVRDGLQRTIPAREIVPGDLVVVTAGLSFPADGLVVGGEHLQVDQSVLTGESHPVRKHLVPEHALETSAIPVEDVHWVSAGTRLLTGTASVRIVFIGGETLYGEIVRSTAGRTERTPLQQAIGNLVAVLLAVAAVFCIALAWIRLSQGFGILDALVGAVTLAVAALPEEFPVVYTFFLGLGVYRLARRRALVRRSVVVESIGRVSCICTDKTGTLTEGRLHLAHVEPMHGASEADLLARAAAAARRESGDPLDVAILQRTGDTAPPHGERLATFPFTEDRRRETAIYSRTPGGLVAVTKGAPETIFDLCTFATMDRIRWQERARALAASGHKVIACAHRMLEGHHWAGGEPDRGFAFTGLLAFEDPVREGVPEAMRLVQDAGVRVIIVTGDHPATAAAVGQELRLAGGEPRVEDGEALAAQLTANPHRVTADVDVIARAYPSHKLALVQALRRQGETVVVTGDGVNDVPALQAADIGIAMGGRGTRSAQDVASIVLLDDNFRTIVEAIAEGQRLFRGLRLSFAFLLMVHFPLVVTAALIPLAGYPLLYLPIHIVWLELLIHPTAMLAFQDLPAAERLDRVARKRVRFFSLVVWMLIFGAGAIIAMAMIWGYDRGLGTERNVAHARAIAISVLVLASAALTLGLTRGRSRNAWGVVALTLASLALVQTPSLAGALHLQPLHVDDLWLAGAVSSGIAVWSVAVGRLLAR